jgi:hypothetical protein
MPADGKDERREQQLERMSQAVDRKAEAARAHAEADSLAGADRPRDEIDVRTKSSGHKKKTARQVESVTAGGQRPIVRNSCRP